MTDVDVAQALDAIREEIAQECKHADQLHIDVNAQRIKFRDLLFRVDLLVQAHFSVVADRDRLIAEVALLKARIKALEGDK